MKAIMINRTIKMYFLLLLSHNAFAVELLSDFVDYAQSVDEFRRVDNDGWSDLSFSSLYRTEDQSFLASIFSIFGTTKQQTSLPYFEQIITEVLKEREQKSAVHSDTKKLLISQETHVIIFGDIDGAFHSFVRCLEKLITLNALSAEMKISEDHYIIINGNAFDVSAYNVETLLLILYLMHKNPERCIYIQGYNEQHFTESSELAKQLNAIADNNSALINMVLSFFHTLPTAVHVVGDDGKGVSIDALRKYQNVTSSIKAAVVTDQNRNTMGLRRSINDITLWSIFSGPTEFNRRSYGFLHDAFAIITSGEAIENWTIQLYYRDVKKEQHMQKSGLYNLVTGELLSGEALLFFDQKERERLQKEINRLEKTINQLKSSCTVYAKAPSMGKDVKDKEKAAEVVDEKSVLAVHEDSIVFGCTLDLSKNLRNQSLSLQSGIVAKIEEINAAGGIHGKQLQVVFLDDEYTPVKARDNVLKFLNEFDTDIILDPLGSPTLERYIDLVKENKLLVLFPITGGFLFRSPDLADIINFRPSYPHELQTLTDYLVMHRHAARVLIFYQNDAFGLIPKEAVKATLRRLNIVNVAEVAYERNTIDFADKAAKIREFDPDTIVFISTVGPTQNLIRQMGVNFFVGKNIFGTSNNFGEASFKNFMRLKGLNFFVPNVVPNPEASDIQIAKEYRAQAEKMHFSVDAVSFEGYITTALLAHLLEGIKGPITKQKIRDAVKNIKNLEFKGLQLNFDHRLDALSKNIWISEGFNEQWTKVHLKALDLWPDVYHAGTTKAETQTSAKEKEGKQEEQKLQEEEGASVAKDLLEISEREKEQPLLSLQENSLRLGSTMDLSKGLKTVSTAYIDGMKLRINEINANGGINGILLTLNVLDDAYLPTKARENVLALLNEHKTDLLIAPIGTLTFSSYIDLIKEGKVLALFPSTGGAVSRKPEYWNVMNYRAGFNVNTGIVTEYIINNIGSKRIAVFYQNDDSGTEPLLEIERLLTKYNITDMFTVSYNRNTLDFAKQAASIKSFNPEAIALLAIPSAAQSFIKTFEPSQLHDKTLFGVGLLNDDAFATYLVQEKLKIFVPSVLPNPETADVELAKEFKNAAQKAGMAPKVHQFEGYFYVALLEHIMKQIEKPITKGKVMKAFEEIKELNFKGILLNFNKERRELARAVWINSGENALWPKLEL